MAYLQEDLRKLFDSALNKHVSFQLTPIELLDSMYYSLRSGGKRLRPVLLLSILSVHSPNFVQKGLNTAIALEYIHTYSLIHDDLPAMDNDDTRRGEPSNHIKYGEATAILAGDALLTDAFTAISTCQWLENSQKVKIIELLAKAAGSTGMVAGQFKDLEAEGKELTIAELQEIHEQKTGALFLFAVQAASVILDLKEEETLLLEKWSKAYGRAYQNHNDLVEYLKGAESVGKSTSSDEKLEKATCVTILGEEEAKAYLEKDIEEARTLTKELTALTGVDYNNALDYFVDYLVID